MIALPVPPVVKLAVLLLLGIGGICAIFGTVMALDAWFGGPGPLYAALLLIGLPLPATGYILLGWFILRGSRTAVHGAMILLSLHTLLAAGVVASGWHTGILDYFAYGLFAAWLAMALVGIVLLRRSLAHVVELAPRGFEPVLRKVERCRQQHHVDGEKQEQHRSPDAAMRVGKAGGLVSERPESGQDQRQ